MEWLLHKSGYKIVPINDNKIEIINVSTNIVEKDPNMLKEIEKGSKFRWSAKRLVGYKYFEVVHKGITERYRAANQFLWVKQLK